MLIVSHFVIKKIVLLLLLLLLYIYIYFFIFFFKLELPEHATECSRVELVDCIRQEHCSVRIEKTFSLPISFYPYHVCRIEQNYFSEE